MSLHSAIPGRILAGDDEQTVTLWNIKRRLGATMSDNRLCAYVTKLIDQKGFPRPLPGFRRGSLVESVIPHSRWLRAAVDTWFDNYLPPDAAEALDRAAMAEAAADMDAAAGHLVLIRGGRA